jgi:sec-independent protein translocase protein TatA
VLEGLTPLHLVLILGIALIVIGPGKLPEAGAAVGKAMRGFRDAMSGDPEPDDKPNT